jgi:hypothetical protein
MMHQGKLQIETAGTIRDTRCLLSLVENPIPGGLLPSIAYFRFGSQCKIQGNKLYLQSAKFSNHFHRYLITMTINLERIYDYFTINLS